VEEYVHRKVVDFVQDFGAKILPSPYGDKGEALAVQEIRFQVLRYHDQCKVSLYHDANEGRSSSFPDSFRSLCPS